MANVTAVAATMVDRLDGCHTAAQIVASNNPDALATYQDLRDLRYHECDSLRAAQSYVTSGDPRELNARSEYIDDPLASDTA
jgi:hypothetical protein